MCLPEMYLKKEKYIMNTFKRLSHTIYECKYHIVFYLKYRYRIFDGDIGEYSTQQKYFLY